MGIDVPSSGEARQSLRDADQTRQRVARSSSKSRAKLNWLAILVLIGTSFVAEATSAGIGALTSIVAGLALMAANYRVPSRQRGWRASDTFITLVTIAAPLAPYVSGAVVNPDDATAGVAWLVLTVLVLAVITFVVVKLGRRIAQ